MPTDDAIARLVADLQGASTAAEEAVGVPPLGTRAVEPAPGRRWYLCAFAGPRFAVLTTAGGLEPDEDRRREVAACVLVVEHAESLIEAGELDVVAAVARRLSGQTGLDAADAALHDLRDGAEALSAWRTAPARAIASMHALDGAMRLHDVTRAAFARFVAATEPLVALQETLPGELVQSLMELEQAAGRVGLGAPLGAAVAEVVEAIEPAVDEILAADVGTA